ncbi:MAG: alpha/beta hydrolase, partial [Pseudomonadota bacterium]
SLLQDNAGLGGRLVAFSWPSDGEQGSYGSDAADLEWSVPDIAEAIIELNRRSGPLGGIHVIGHGLGARGRVFALDEVAQREPEIQIGEVVLLAADVDFGVFSRLLPRISSIAEGVTVYINDSDRPLALAAQLDGYPRLGQVGNDVAGLGNAEFIDVTGVQAGSADRHSYHIYSEAVGQNLENLLNGSAGAFDGRRLHQSDSNTWVLLP